MSDTTLSAARPALSVRLEYAALLAFALVLPLFEAPKNLLWIAYVLLWLANRRRSGALGGGWDAWDTLIALWIASGYLVAACAAIRGAEWGAANDILRYGSVLWLLKRSRYPERVLVALLACLALGTLAALAWGYYGLLVTRLRRTLGLKSVGHVNHSAIYLAIVFGMVLAATRAYWSRASIAARAGGLALLAAFAASLFVMQSRGATGAAALVALCVPAAYALRLRHSLRPLALGALVAAALVLAVRPQVVEKNEALLERNLFLAYRDGIWRVGIAAWREHPLFGVGMSNYGLIGYDRLEDWAAKRGEKLDRTRYVPASHGHSLYVNALAERGIAGLAILLAVLGAWAHALVRRLPRATSPPLEWAYWGGAASAWIVAVFVGVVNTTLHHEHALASMLLLGGWLSLVRARPA